MRAKLFIAKTAEAKAKSMLRLEGIIKYHTTNLRVDKIFCDANKNQFFSKIFN